MKLLKGSVFLREFFEKPRPTKAQLEQWIVAGEVPGKLLPDGPYVDVNQWIGAGPRFKPVQKASGIDLLR